ncbi:uncharacterized protein LOC110911156 isoform X7 [Helianthus annuus]|uniref:uncharacterized protein LOC110911156 isoform X7 n=2 Tax=Helianthus annuus TaxID=4232 RepID=UPI0016532CF4|nr:uncharacterized protein LOC110911156 isoform X7 [Helianthus annuus]
MAATVVQIWLGFGRLGQPGSRYISVPSCSVQTGRRQRFKSDSRVSFEFWFGSRSNSSVQVSPRFDRSEVRVNWSTVRSKMVKTSQRTIRCTLANARFWNDTTESRYDSFAREYQGVCEIQACFGTST